MADVPSTTQGRCAPLIPGRYHTDPSCLPPPSQPEEVLVGLGNLALGPETQGYPSLASCGSEVPEPPRIGGAAYAFSGNAKAWIRIVGRLPVAKPLAIMDDMSTCLKVTTGTHSGAIDIELGPKLPRGGMVEDGAGEPCRESIGRDEALSCRDG